MNRSDLQNLARELVKVSDVLRAAEGYFMAKDTMNAGLHMASVVRPTPLATAVSGAVKDIDYAIDDIRQALREDDVGA